MKDEKIQAADMIGAVLEYLNERPDRRCTCLTLAKRFGVSADALRPVLEARIKAGDLAKMSQPRRGWYFYIPKKGADNTEDKTKEAKEAKNVFMTKEYKPGKEWDHINERLAEYRHIKSKF